jgi:hypothetical protein
MADEYNRPYRAHDPYGRPSDAGGTQQPANDPLAELARLIGQNDAFADSGRAAPARPRGTNGGAPQWSTPDPVRTPQQPSGDPYRQPLGPQHPGHGEYPQTAPEELHYADQGYDPRYAQADYEDPRYSSRGYAANAPHDGGVHFRGQHQGYDEQAHAGQFYPSMQPGEEIYEDVAPARRRGGIVTALALLTLATIGAAGAFGYRAMFSSGGGTAPPPVIKADTTPNKVVPAAQSSDQGPGKLIYDRVGEQRNQGERIVVREEQPVDIQDARSAPRVVSGIPNTPGTAAPGAPVITPAPTLSSPAPNAVPAGTPEPKRVRTVTIRPDQLGGEGPSVRTSATPPPPAAAPAPGRVTSAPASALARTASAASPAATPPAAIAPQPASNPAPTPAPAAPRPSRAQHSAPAPTATAGNAPLSLAPPGTAAPAPTRRTTRTAAAGSDAAAVSSGVGGSYTVQVSSQRSEVEAQSAFRAMQARYPTLLGDRQPIVRRADLGDKGVYYRAQVGPFGTAEQANAFCSSLKSAGGACVVQRN